MNRASVIGGVAMLLIAACESEAEGEAPSSAVALVDPRHWTVADPADDLFSSMRPAEIDCDAMRGYYVDEGPPAIRFEINTGWCNYVTVTQPLLESLDAGDTVEIRVWHFELTGGPGEAYLGVGIGSTIVWEQMVPIPNESALVQGRLQMLDAFEAGTPIQFHVNNHGSNTWEIYAIDKRSSGS